MFTQVLRTQVKFTRILVAAFAVATFAAPALAWRIGAWGGYPGTPSALAVRAGFDPVGLILMSAACLLGFLLVAVPWNVDGASRHVYPLSLPIPWKRYVSMRFGAGALLLLLPVLSLWLGALVTLALMELPATLRAYPGGLAIRFGLASLLVYAFTFLLQYLAGRRAPVIFLVLLVVVAAVGVLGAAGGLGRGAEQFFRLLTEWPGPLSIFAAEWRLVDV